MFSEHSRRRCAPWDGWGLALLAIAFLCIFPGRASSQVGSVRSTEWRPFVISFIPVIGRNGAIGGVSIDGDGFVDRAETAETAKLSDAWLKAARPVAAELNRASELRKVSLPRLEAALGRYLERNVAIPDEMLFLAGLQRIDYVFVYPEANDIVIAGPADGWHLDRRGAFVGNTTHRPVMRLDDLIEAFQAAADASGAGMSCSIDPTEEGLVRLQRLLRSRDLQFNAGTVERMQQAVGAHRVTVRGVAPDSHFGHVMVAADFLLKRLAMGLEKSPVPALPSYMDLLRQQPARVARLTAPRWWLAVDYEGLDKSPDGLAWQLRGRHVATHTEDGYLTASGRVVDAGRAEPLAEEWARAMTKNYAPLAEVLPALAELQNCMDAAIVAALVTRHRLTSAAGCRLPLL